MNTQNFSGVPGDAKPFWDLDNVDSGGGGAGPGAGGGTYTNSGSGGASSLGGGIGVSTAKPPEADHGASGGARAGETGDGFVLVF